MFYHRLKSIWNDLVWHRLKGNKLRFFLTGFSLMWGMCMMVVLQAVSYGFCTKMKQKFCTYLNPNMMVYPGHSSECPIEFTYPLADYLMHRLSDIRSILPILAQKAKVSSQYADLEAAVLEAAVLGVPCSYTTVCQLEVVHGRPFVVRDGIAFATCILGAGIQKQLFKEQTAVGKSILVNGQSLYVVGVLQESSGSNDRSILVMPEAFHLCFSKQPQSIDYFIVEPYAAALLPELEKKIRLHCTRYLNFSKEDPNAVDIFNPYKTRQRFERLFRVVHLFSWFVGLCFLFSALVNLGNMMVVVVRERISELAIRKIFGSSTGSLVLLIMGDALFTSMVFGLMGITVGRGLVYLANTYCMGWLEKSHLSPLKLEYVTIILIFIVLVLSGCLAALWPIRRVLSIQPIEVLNKK